MTIRLASDLLEELDVFDKLRRLLASHQDIESIPLEDSSPREDVVLEGPQVGREIMVRRKNQHQVNVVRLDLIGDEAPIDDKTATIPVERSSWRYCSSLANKTDR